MIGSDYAFIWIALNMMEEWNRDSKKADKRTGRPEPDPCEIWKPMGIEVFPLGVPTEPIE